MHLDSKQFYLQFLCLDHDCSYSMIINYRNFLLLDCQELLCHDYLMLCQGLFDCLLYYLVTTSNHSIHFLCACRLHILSPLAFTSLLCRGMMIVFSPLKASIISYNIYCWMDKANGNIFNFQMTNPRKRYDYLCPCDNFILFWNLNSMNSIVLANDAIPLSHLL